MRRMFAVVAWVVLFVSAMGARAQEAASAPAEDGWSKLAAANNLDAKGNMPFHLVMTFQLYDLDGKATKTGTFEEWWVAQGSSLIIVHLAGLNEDGSAPEGASAELLRNAFLVRQLIGAAVHPVMAEPQAGKKFGEKSKEEKFGKITLSCITPAVGSTPVFQVPPTTLCVQPQTEAVLIARASEGNETVVRSSTGKFHDIYVGLDIEIGFLGRNTIAGKIMTLQSFDPAKSEVKLAAPTGAKPEVVHASGGVIAGHRIKFTEPGYPVAAKALHTSGSVLLHAVIGKDGSVERLVPIASTDLVFTDAAIESVKKWKYLPYLLNGEAVEVDTSITVNFEIR